MLWKFSGYDIDDNYDNYLSNPLENEPPVIGISLPCTHLTDWENRSVCFNLFDFVSVLSDLFVRQ